jgi:hypothetical protein
MVTARRQIPQIHGSPDMIGPTLQQRIDPVYGEIAEAERLIGMHNERIIAGLCKGIDTTDAENKAAQMRGALEAMKARGRKQAGIAITPEPSLNVC